MSRVPFIDTELEDIIIYGGYKTEEYTERSSGTPRAATREVLIIDIEQTILNLVNVINQLRRDVVELKAKNHVNNDS
jgi:hypothetical protein